MDLRTKICIWIIVIGMVNFLAFTIGYTIIGGEAIRGKITVDAGGDRNYYLDSEKKVSHGVFLYSGIHCISIWLSVAAIMLSMLTLAKDRIVDSMHAAVVRGRTFCTVVAVLIGITTGGLTFLFIRQFANHYENPKSAQVETRPAKGDTDR
jgi:hypothetical protein